ncbi:hypothetical protein [Kineosporia babensis]|uniref:Uncharacterized protein n=1 Tax=Kineosporia babensis TaxID=499548 RepID=A0A9X1NCR2_9ACTN|nr:hypothetical protein [Kineosporia babensis]MCD5311371.1 hypothetical protein [Kineosporia babensis]
MTRTVGAALLAALLVGGLVGCGGDTPTSDPIQGETAPDQRAPDEGSPTLSDTGFGELKLGMSLKQATALGLVKNPAAATESAPGCQLYEGEQGLDQLFFVDDQLLIIYPEPPVRLDTGIGVGDTYEQLQGAYGDRVQPSEGFARVYVTAPQAPFDTDYRIEIDSERAFRDSRIERIALEAKDHGCYE